MYWDTSALVKQFLTERGTQEVLTLRAKGPSPQATATITYPEVFPLCVVGCVMVLCRNHSTAQQ